MLATLSSLLLEYDTLKVVHIRSKKVGSINRLIQLVIIGYIIGYVIVIKKGYQETEPVDGAATAKLKGASYPLNASLSTRRVWDAADYHIPPQQSNAFFVMTNMIITPNQRNGTCPESLKNMPCKTEKDCRSDHMVPTGNGMMTGRCVPFNATSEDLEGGDDRFSSDAIPRTCEIISWCPIEKDVTPETAVLGRDARNFTVLIKNSIIFRKFSVRRRNIPDTMTEGFLKHCHYDPNDAQNKFCPIFPLYRIFELAGVADQWENAAKFGAVMAINIQWDCNLDHGKSNCQPKYTFGRVDDPGVALSPGFNFRYSQYYSAENDTMARTLTKAYGILFIIKITGDAGKFSVVPLMINLASGLALLSLAAIMCDFVVLHFLKKRKFYHEKKFEEVEVEDDILPSQMASTSETDSLIQHNKP